MNEKTPNHFISGGIVRSVQMLAVTALCLTAAAGAAHAVEFKSVGAAPAILYDAPSQKGRKVFVAPREMPVEVVLTYGEWSKVRDATGELSWVESKALSPMRHVVATVQGAKVRAAGDEKSALIFTADKGVLFELVEPVASGWVKVRHRDGQSGYIKAAEVWGE
jgi:SH3-like domain-containing protein